LYAFVSFRRRRFTSFGRSLPERDVHAERANPIRLRFRLRGLVRIEPGKHERELATHFTPIEVSLEHASTRWDQRPIEKLGELCVIGTIAGATIGD
jgi:hypothetical protein